jgi:autotransporter-associated beta strand protein
MRFGPLLGLVALASCSIASAQTPSVNFSLNTASTAAISPYIYGINGTSLGSYSNPTFERTGGNRITAYNWTNNDSNAGSDWYYENDGAYSSSTTAGAGMASAITPALNGNAGIVVAVPINGYVAKDRLGGNADVRYYPGTSTFDPNWLSDRFVPEQPAKPGGPASFTLTPSPTSTVVYEDEFVNWVKTTYPAGFTTNTTTPIWFEMDNEPDLWASTHAELRPVVAGSVTTSNPLGTPTPVTYAELVQKTTAYATAIKAVAPNTKIFGPVSYGWNGYTTLQNAPDSGADGDFLTYYLNQMAAASKTANLQTADKRLVDVLDLHWYPEAQGAGIRIVTADSGYSGSTLSALMTARIQAPRSLWDTTYTESSWITSSLGGPIYLLPREQAKITAVATANNNALAAYVPNQISISEYNYGGGDDISGGIAQADVLGIFGQQGLLSANEWPMASNESYIGGGFLMYRNYDGKGSTFGDTSVAITGNSTNAANASLYASEDSKNLGRMVLVAINKTTGNLTDQIPLPTAPNGNAFTIALVYKLTAASSTPQFADEIFVSNPATFSYTMPGYSVNTIALTVASASVWSTAAGGSWNLTGNWTGGLPNAAGAIAAINASTTSAQTVTLDAPQTVGTLFLGNSGGTTVGYTLSGSGSNKLTLNNSGNGAVIAVSDGTHAINAPVTLADNLQVCGGNTGWTLSFGAAGIISGGYPLTMSGNGTLVLSGQNTYTGVTTLAAGIVNLNAAENAGTSGPLGNSAAVNQGSIVFNGGTLQYSAANQSDYSGRFSTAANQAYDVDTNGQNVTWASGLTSSGGSLAKLGNGTLTLSAASTNLTAANVSGGGLAFSSGTIGTLNLNTGAGSSTINSGNLTSINVNAGGVAISGGTIGTCNYNSAAGTNTIAAGNVTAINVNAGGVAINGGTIGAFNHNTGAGTSTIGAGAAISAINVNSGTVNFNSTQANGALVLPAGSTGTVIVGPASGGLPPKVATADFSGTPATGTVNATNPLAITGTLKLPGGLSATLSNGTYFTATGANLASTSTPSTLGLRGGTLTFPTGATSQSIGVHWAGYGDNTTTPVTGTDGVVPQGHWTNLAAGWYSGGASNLVNNSGSATTAAVTCAGNGAGTCWWRSSIAPGVDNLVLGPGGGSGAIMNAITGIPFLNYEIIAYVNDYQAAGSQFAVWLDGSPSSSSPTNAPLAGSRYYYGATYNNPVGFVQMTNNSNASTYSNANYVVWSGLSGSSQTLWTRGWSSSGANDNNNNEGITGFQIVSNAGPANVNLPATAIAVTASSTLSLASTPVLGNLSLSNNSGTGTTLTLAGGATNMTFGNITLAAGTILDASVNNIPVIAAGLYDNDSTSTAGEQIKLGSTTLTISGATPPATFSGVISGTGSAGLVMNGPGTQILAGNNTYTGTTTVNGGTLSISKNSNLGGTGVVLNGGALSASAPFQLLHPITVGPATAGTGAGTLDVASGAILTYNGVISDNSATTPGAIGALVKTGAGELELGGTGNYTGGTSVEDGLLVIDSSEAILSGSTVATTVNGKIVLGDPSLPSDGTSLGGLAPGSGLGSGGGLAASANVGVPEPGTLALLAAGAIGLLACTWRRRRV